MAFTDYENTLIENMVEAFFNKKKDAAYSAGEYRRKDVMKVDEETYVESWVREDDETYNKRIADMEDGWRSFISDILEPIIPVLLTHLEDNHEAPTP